MRNHYLPWLIENIDPEGGKSNVTKLGYLSAPDVDTIIKWLLLSKDDINNDLILTSFEKTGIVNVSRRHEIYMRN